MAKTAKPYLRSATILAALALAWYPTPSAAQDRPGPRPTLQNLAGENGLVRGCDADTWFDRTPPSAFDTQFGDAITLTANLDDAGPDKDRIWHLVRNRGRRSISFTWRSPEDGMDLARIVHGDGLEPGDVACQMNEGSKGGFVSGPASDFKLNTSGWDRVRATHYHLAPEAPAPADEAEPVPDDLTRSVTGRDLRLADGEPGWVGAEIVIAANPDGLGFDVTLLHSPPEIALLVSERAFADGAAAFARASQDSGAPEVPIVALSEFLGDAAGDGLEDLRSERFHLLEWTEEGYALVATALADPFAPVIILDADRRPVLVSQLVFAAVRNAAQ